MCVGVGDMDQERKRNREMTERCGDHTKQNSQVRSFREGLGCNQTAVGVKTASFFYSPWRIQNSTDKAFQNCNQVSFCKTSQNSVAREAKKTQFF